MRQEEDRERGNQVKEDRRTIKVKKPVKVREMRARNLEQENSLPTGSLPQQRVLGRAEVGMRTELEGITGRWTDCGEEN